MIIGYEKNIKLYEKIIEVIKGQSENFVSITIFLIFNYLLFIFFLISLELMRTRFENYFIVLIFLTIMTTNVFYNLAYLFLYNYKSKHICYKEKEIKFPWELNKYYWDKVLNYLIYYGSINQMIIPILSSILGVYFKMKFWVTTLYSVDQKETPSFLGSVSIVMVYFIFAEATYTITHILSHTKFFYSNFHCKQHVVNINFSSVYMMGHPIDHILNFYFPLIIGPVCLLLFNGYDSYFSSSSIKLINANFEITTLVWIVLYYGYVNDAYSRINLAYKFSPWGLFKMISFSYKNINDHFFQRRRTFKENTEIIKLINKMRKVNEVDFVKFDEQYKSSNNQSSFRPDFNKYRFKAPQRIPGKFF